MNLVKLIHCVVRKCTCVCIVLRADTLSTVGVDVGIWKYRKDLEPDQQRLRKKGNKPMRNVTFYTWDFGGQVSSEMGQLKQHSFFIASLWFTLSDALVL